MRFGENTKSMYKKFFKRLLDFLISFIAIIVLTPVWIILSILIFVTDPGKILFTQKRVGKNKKFFKILKFRTMKMSTPKDVPTHMLENPDQYFTPIGKFLRKTSLDELPQLFNIFVGQMAIIGPRPALWNQDDLIEERDRYNANSVRPGLTGWAQINGRDELEIPVKAKFDGEYVEKMSFAFDVKCFFGTIKSVVKHEGVVEGGTGEIKREKRRKATFRRLRVSKRRISLRERETRKTRLPKREITDEKNSDYGRKQLYRDKLFQIS